MKRPLLVLGLALGILGTLAIYARFLASLPTVEPAHDRLVQPAAAKFSLEITCSCPVEADAFSLDSASGVSVRFLGKEIVSRERHAGTEPLVVNDLPGIESGNCTFSVRAIPAAGNIGRPNALRLKLLGNGEAIAEQTIWSRSEEPIVGELVLKVPKENAKP